MSALPTSFPPLVSVQTRLLVLGSFPGVASLEAQQYYGHPRNHFWRILLAIWPGDGAVTFASSYQQRCSWLLDRKLGLWDVFAECEREGSLDSNIRNAVLNDFSALKTACPHLQAVAFNGGMSFRHAPRVRAALAENAAGAEVMFYSLPSTSPANASWTL